jgi:hypothetical protein
LQQGYDHTSQIRVSEQSLIEWLCKYKSRAMIAKCIPSPIRGSILSWRPPQLPEFVAGWMQISQTSMTSHFIPCRFLCGPTCCHCFSPWALHSFLQSHRSYHLQTEREKLRVDVSCFQYSRKSLALMGLLLALPWP